VCVAARIIFYQEVDYKRSRYSAENKLNSYYFFFLRPHLRVTINLFITTVAIMKTGLIVVESSATALKGVATKK
jgi:hypothetical protein